MKGDRLLTVAEVAERVGLKHQAVRRAVSRGDLEAVRLCGRIRIEPVALEAWIDSGRVRRASGRVSVVPSVQRASASHLRRLLDA